MKVLFLVKDPIHYGLAAANRITCYGKGLMSNNTDVEIIMPFAFIARKDIQFDRTGTFDQVPYTYQSFLNYHPTQRHGTVLAGIIYLFKITFGYMNFFVTILKSKAEIIYVYRFSNLVTLIILLLCRNKKVISELCEFPYFNDHSNLKKIRLGIREKLVFPLFDGFIVISSYLQEYIDVHRSHKSSLIKIPILFDPFQSKGLSKSSISDIPFILHSGSLSESKDGFSGLLEAVGLLNSKGRRIDLYITGTLKPDILHERFGNLIEKYSLDKRIKLIGYLKHNELVQYQFNSSMFILNRKMNLQNFYNFPTKLGEYLVTGNPVVVTTVGEPAQYLRDKENAFFFNDGDIAKLVEIMEYILANPEESNAIGKKGREIAENHFDCYKNGTLIKSFFSTIILK